MPTHPKIIEQLDQLAEQGRNNPTVVRIVETTKARLKAQDELLEDKLTVRDHYAMAALQGFTSRPFGDRYPLADCFLIADLMMELRRG